MSPASRQRARLVGSFTVTEDGRAAGHAFDEAAPAALVVEILADGLSLYLTRADLWMPDLADTDAAWSGFSVRLPNKVLLGAATIEARLANTGERLGAPVVLAESRPASAVPPLAHVAWAGGLRLTGRLDKPADAGATVKALIDGDVVAEVSAKGWAMADVADRSLPAFDIHLPARYADGRVRHVDVLGPDGSGLPGSPCFVVAFADGLEAFLDARAELASERIRARFAQALLPQSWPFSGAAEYLERFAPQGPKPVPPVSAAVILVGEEGLDASLSSLDLGGTVIAACLPRNGSATQFTAGDLVDLLQGDAAEAALVVFATSGTLLRAGALAALADALHVYPDAPFAYADYAVRDGDRLWPMLLPGFDLERWMEQGYAAAIFAMRTGRALAAARSGASSVFHLVNETLDMDLSTAGAPIHVPLVLADVPSSRGTDDPALEMATRKLLGRIDREASVAPRLATTGPAVRIRRPGQGMVSIVIPTRAPSARLTQLVESLRPEIQRAALEVILVDDGAQDPAGQTAWTAVERCGGIRVTAPGPFPSSRARNAGAAAATGRYLLFVDDGVVPEESWAAVLEELVGRMAGPGVGAVGPVVAWSSGLIRSAGLVLGPGLAAAPAFADRLVGEAGYAGLLEVAHEVSALSATAMMTRRDLFHAQGGFDGLRFALSLSDVDYCLGLRAKNLRIVVTPDARMTSVDTIAHPTLSEPHQARLAREKAALQNRWGAVLMADPFYHPCLSLDGPAYSALAWPPRDRVVRTNRIEPPRTVPSGL